MSQVSEVIKTFFADFERASNGFEPNFLVSQFSDPYMAADPHGNIQVVGRDEFLAGTAINAFLFSLRIQALRSKHDGFCLCLVG